MWVLESVPGPLQEQQVLSTAELFYPCRKALFYWAVHSQPLFMYFVCSFDLCSMCLSACLWGADVSIEITGQLWGISGLFPPHGFWGRSPGYQTWWQGPHARNRLIGSNAEVVVTIIIVFICGRKVLEKHFLCSVSQKVQIRYHFIENRGLSWVFKAMVIVITCFISQKYGIHNYKHVCDICLLIDFYWQT